MALVKCKECNKEISDKAKTCIHCGCPINESKENKKTNNVFTKIWLVICILTCLFISAIYFINIFNILNLSINIGNIAINVMGILALLLGGAYIFLLITFSKKSFHILLGINALILIYNLLNIEMGISIFYIILVLINSLITFFVVRKQLKKEKLKIKHYIPLFITLILAIALTFITSDNQNNYYDSDTNIGNERDSSIAQIEIITEYINIRSNKSVNSTIVGQVHYGEIYTIISEDVESSYHWFEIETTNGIKGFISGKDDYVKVLEITNKNEDVEKPTEEEIKEENISNNTSNNNTSNNNNKKPTNSTKPSTNNNTNSNSSNNNTSNKNNSSSSTKKEETKKEETNIDDKETNKKIISATPNYSCSSFSYDFDSINKVCVKESYTSDPSIRTLVCPSGYEANTGKNCKAIIKENVEPTEQMACSDGSTPDYINNQYFCRSGQLYVKKVCPSGYNLISSSAGFVTVYMCEWSTRGYKTGYYTCSNGYTLASNDLCFKIITKEPIIKYSCPNGYSLKDDKCYEN